MKKWTNHNKIIFKRIISFTLVLVLLVTGIPMELLNYVSEDLAEKSGLELTAKAADVDSALLSKYSAHSYIFNSNNTSSMTIDGVTVNISLAEYSQCFQDPTWAEAHANDIIQLNPIGGVFIFDTGYNPIGNINNNCAFGGTIILTTGADEFNVQTRGPIFECVKDSVTIKRNQDSENIPFNINRVADVGNTVSALFANHVIGTSSTELNNWKVTLNANSVCSYSGVIYEMTDGAKIDLTFEDKSDHTPVLDNNDNIYSGSIIDNKADNKHYGILCGALTDESVLHATYTKANDDEVTFIGTETANCGGLIGEINGSTFELLSGSSSTKVDFTTPKDHVGFICGHAEDSMITLPDGYTFSGTVDGNQYAGGIAGYCENTTVNYETASGAITLNGCNIKNGTTTGGVFGYYECNTAANDILLDRTYTLSGCTVEGKGVSGGIAGEYKPTYASAVTIDLNKYTLGNTISLSGTTTGGLIGKFTSAGKVTITDSDTNTPFAPPSSSVKYGGVIGEYVNTNYANTLTLSGFTVDGISCSATGSVGGVVCVLNGSTYVSVNGVSVTNVTANNAAYFGGIISTLDNNAGSFIDVSGNYLLSMATGKTYKGGAIAGSFKKGVIRLAGVTDISGAKAENGYAQLVYENDETLVYAKGSGSDANWTLKRNASTTASDLGQWGEVVRLFNGQNAEAAGIVSVANNKVTVAQGVTTINDTVSFAKCALNMQLNDGSDHGALCFASGGANKTSLLSSNITVSGEIDLSGTGLLGFMRDIKTDDIFKGKIIGDDGQTNKITLAVGEDYGVGTGGNIYLSNGNNSNGHNAQGLLAYSQSANVSNLTVDGFMNINRLGIGNSLYAGAVSGYVTGGISLNKVSADPVINFSSTKSDQNVYIGGVAGIYDEKKAATGFTINDSIITPTINISGNNALTTAHRYGGVLGYLNGGNDTADDFTIENSTLTPKITIANGSTEQNEAYIGGLIAMVGNGKQQTITIRDTNITDADISTKSYYAGGLLGHRWENVNVSIDGLSITGSSVNNTYSNAANNGGLVFASHGVWDVESISIDANSRFTTTNGNSFGLLVNEGYRSATDNNNGLYLKVKNSGLNYAAGITVTEATNMDEICVKTADNADKVVSGGDSVGVLSIDMNIGTNTETKISETGTYQNKITAFANRRPNSLSRYYYGLQLMKENAEATGGEQFLLWSVRKYASSNIKNMFKDSDDMIASTSIDLSGLSYYPIATDSVTLPDNSTVKFGFNDVKAAESNSSFNTDSYYRNPDDIGNARNQHYLMQTGLFTTVSSLSASTLTLTGDFGYVSGVASGALINKSTSGTVTLTGLKLNGLKPSSADSYMLINSIDGTGTATPTLTVSNLRAENYASTTLPVAKSLFGTATGQNMTMTFSDIKIDARDGTAITDTKWTTGENSAASAMYTAYGTSRSIFSTATFFTELWAANTCNMEYNYAVEKDWNTATGPREVTYGKEVTASIEYPGGEKRYFLAGDAYGNYTNPVSNSGIEFDFSAGFLPYVGNYTDKEKNTTYPVTEIKVNYKAPGITVGCGTYNDPYIISSATQLVTIAKTINGDSSGYPSVIRLPNVYNADHVITSWHGAEGDGLYNHSGTGYSRTDTTTGITSWTENRVRYYLASAYYKIVGSPVLPSDFTGIGVPNDSSNNFKGNTVFHGVIVGDKTSKPTITIPNGNPLIVVANGAVVKNIDIKVTGDVTRTQNETGSNALYGYNGSTTDAQYYGGVIGEIMGGDNIIDDVKVTYSGTTTLDGSAKHLIAEGGMVGAVVNGALIFRGTNSVSGRSVTGGGIYSNQFVGRVINGYAIYEKISTRTKATDVAPDNYNTCVVDEEDESKVTKTYTYPIDTIDRSNTNKIDVNWTNSTITVPDAQSLYIMSLITQSIASTANTSGNGEYGTYSPSYGYNSYITGVARLGDYSSVGCGTSAEKPADYSSYASKDSVNNKYSATDDLLKAPIPYIIYRYTKAYGTNTIASKNYPARMMTFDKTKFWDITLPESDTFEDFDDFQAFRGIGCVGINAYATNNDASKIAFKVATFDGGGNTINLHISLPRYRRDQENYFHKQNKSLTQTYTGDELTSPYGHDTNLHKLMGLGLFDYVMVNSKYDYQFHNFQLQGIIEDKVYDTNGNDITGKKTVSNNKEVAGQTQLFCVGGVIGKRVNGNDYDLNFSNIKFDGLTITGAYSCGGLIGIDAIKAAKRMEIAGCNSTSNGISVTGGYFGGDSNIRHGIGSFVGMTFWCRPYINGKTSSNDVSDIFVSNVSTFYDGDYGCSVGGLIGYTGSGAEIKNINLVAVNSDAVIGGEKSSNAAGFIGFTQAMTENKNGSANRTEPNADDLKDCVYIENCTIQNLPIKAKNGAGGFVAKTGNSDTWHTKYIYINNCAVIGDADNKPEIKAYGNGTATSTNCVGGFVGDLRSSVVTCLIQNSYIKDYTIEGWHVGGIIGETTYRSANLRNLYVKNCEVIRNNTSGAIGGIVGYSNQNLNGYNLKIDGVVFKKKNGSSYSEAPGDAGIILGANDNNNKIDKFVGIGAYHTTDSKVPVDVVKSYGANANNFFVFADYKSTSAADVTAGKGYASTFGVTTENSVASYPAAPYVNTAPHIGVGTSEYLTGDGASIGKAGEIYKDYKAGSSNRRYGVGNSTTDDTSVNKVPDATTLAHYINNDGSYKNGAFKISTALAEFGTLPQGVQNFAMLVINDDTDKTNDITPFIKSYIRLVTNAEKSANQYKNNLYAYATSGNTEVNNLYQVVIRPCYYSEANGEFVLGTAGSQGLTSSDGLYSFVSANADSEAGNYQFSLIDVQFKDPTDTTQTQIAYHLYVPVYTKKMLTAEFSAVSMTETKYYRTPYSDKISAELARNKSASDPSLLVESTDAWTTTFIRYTYPKKQISQADTWNYDKSVKLNIDTTNFQALPVGTKFILVDPNANADKYYTYELTSAWSGEHTLNLSDFMDNSDEPAPFSPQNLSDIMADQNASSGNELYEDYYISIYVPMTTGHTHGILVGSGAEMQDSGREHKANIVPKLYSSIVLGDLFAHEITNNSFSVESGDGHETWGDNPEMTPANNVLKTQVTATIQIKNADAGAYLASSSVYHAFFISLTSHDADHKVSDIIRGTNQGSIHNTTTYSYTDNQGNHSQELNPAFLGPNYVKLETGNILGALYQNGNTPVVTVHSETTMEFFDVTAFPYNVNSSPKIGTQVSVKSSLAYDSKDLLFSSLNDIEEDPDGKFYYSTTKNNAELTFNGSREIDSDAIGYKTNNMSTLGVNGLYEYSNEHSHPLLGVAVYNVDDIIDYDSAKQLQYTVELSKKVTDVNGTRYEKVNNIGDYLSNVKMIDPEVNLSLDLTDQSHYVFTGNISHQHELDSDKMFVTNFSCNVLTGDTQHNEYANYKISITAELLGASNSLKDSYLIYTNAKIDPTVVDEP